MPGSQSESDEDYTEGEPELVASEDSDGSGEEGEDSPGPVRLLLSSSTPPLP